MDSVLLIVALGAVAAGFVQGLSGFGFGMVAMSFWAWTLEPRLAALLAVCGALTGQLVAAATVRRGFDRVRLLPFVLGGLVGIPIGVAVLPRLDMDAFKVILGTLLVLWCPAMLMAKQLPRITRGGRVADALVGMAGGVMGLLFLVVGVAVIAGAALLVAGRWRDGLQEVPADAARPASVDPDVPVGTLTATSGSTYAAPDAGDTPVLIHCVWNAGCFITIREGGDRAIAAALADLGPRAKSLFASPGPVPGVILQLILDSIDRQLTSLQTEIALLDGQIIVTTKMARKE